MAGFVVGAVSRGTLWASVLACCGPCLYCLSKWPGHGLSGLRLLIFVLPGLWGVWRGRRDLRLGLGWAVFLAAMATLAPADVGQGWMDVRLLAVVAGLVPDGDGAAEAGVNREN